MCDCLRLNRREYDVIGIAYNDGSRSPPVCRVDQHPSLPCFLDDPLDRSRLRADDRHDSVGGDDVAEADIDQLDLHRSLTQLFQECANLTLTQSLNSSAFMNADFVHDFAAGHFTHLW